MAECRKVTPVVVSKYVLELTPDEAEVLTTILGQFTCRPDSRTTPIFDALKGAGVRSSDEYWVGQDGSRGNLNLYGRKSVFDER